MPPVPDQAAAKAMADFFTLDREVNLTESNEEFVDALTTGSCLIVEDCSIDDRVEMLGSAALQFNKGVKENTWAIQALTGHPHGRTYVANVKADLDKSKLTRDCAVELQGIKVDLRSNMAKCMGSLLEGDPAVADAIVTILQRATTVLKKTKSFDCHVHLLPSAEELETGAVATLIYDSLRNALERVCTSTTNSGDLKVWAALLGPGFNVMKVAEVHVALKLVPGVIQSTIEWKANVWMVKVRAGPIGKPRPDLPDWRLREMSQLGASGWAPHPPLPRWLLGFATWVYCWRPPPPTEPRSRNWRWRPT